MAKSKLMQLNKHIEEIVLDGYQKMESNVVAQYQKIEDGFVDRYLTQDHETISEAKQRLNNEKEERRKIGNEKK